MGGPRQLLCAIERNIRLRVDLLHKFSHPFQARVTAEEYTLKRDYITNKSIIEQDSGKYSRNRVIVSNSVKPHHCLRRTSFKRQCHSWIECYSKKKLFIM